jgi:hypothetical protein
MLAGFSGGVSDMPERMTSAPGRGAAATALWTAIAYFRKTTTTNAMGVAAPITKSAEAPV